MRVTWNVVLLLAGIVGAVLFGLAMGFGWWDEDQRFMVVGFGLAAFMASFVQWGRRA